MEAAKRQAAETALNGGCVTDAATLRAFVESFKEELHKLKQQNEGQDEEESR